MPLPFRQLLTHKSGMEPLGSCDCEFWECMRKLCAKPLVDTPGNTHVYSNGNSALLGAIIMEVTGKSEVAAIQDEVLKPMGVTGIDDKQAASDIALYYKPGDYFAGRNLLRRWPVVLERKRPGQVSYRGQEPHRVGRGAHGHDDGQPARLVRVDQPQCGA